MNHNGNRPTLRAGQTSARDRETSEARSRVSDEALRKKLHSDLTGDLNRIAKRFISGAKLTLIVRTPIPNANVVLSSDSDVDAVIAELREWEKYQ